MTYHARRIKEKVDGTTLYKPIQADPTVRNRNERDGVSYRDYFLQISGIWLDEANNNLLDGIDRVRDFMYLGKLKFFTSCINLKEEAGDYVWRKDKNGITLDDPVDRKNHLMDALRYLCMALPINLRDCYISRSKEVNNKNNLLERLQPDTNIDDFLRGVDDGIGGAFGLGNFDMN